MSTILRPRRQFAGVVLAVTLPFLVGCGGSGSVEGKVTYRPNGKNLVWGAVVITGRDNVARSGVIKPDGSYVVTGVPAGEAVIRVSSENPKAEAQLKGGRGGRGGGDDDRRANEPNPPGITIGSPGVPEAVLKGWFPIPPKYADPAQSLLKLTIKHGRNQHDITLE